MKNIKHYVLLVFMLTTIINCSDPEEITLDNSESTAKVTALSQAYYVDQDHPNASDSNDGRYVVDGGTGPWKTIQKMLNTLEAGEMGYVRESCDPYIPTVTTNAFDFTAFFVTKSGTINNPIIISGYPGERPRIGFDTFQEGIVHEKYAGFATDYTTSYVTIKNFEIAHLTGSGIFTNPDHDPPNVGLVFEELYIHDILGVDNTAGVRLDGCDDCVVKNNIIHDIYSSRTNSNAINNKPYGLHSGIHGYQPGNCTIENNLIYNVSKGVFQKQADQNHKNSHVVRNNIIYNAEVAFAMEIQGVGSPAPRNAEFYKNIVYDVGMAVDVPLQQVGEQGDGIKIFNNTIVNAKSIGYVQEMINIEVFNNIVYGKQPAWSTSTNQTVVFSTGPTIGQYNFVNGFSYFDNNIYFNVSDFWILERYGSAVKYINTLSNWQNTLEPNLGLNFKPDQVSQIIDPLFTNINDKDFSLQSNSPALTGGRGGVYDTVLGAVKQGDNIGPNWSVQ